VTKGISKRRRRLAAAAAAPPRRRAVQLVQPCGSGSLIADNRCASIAAFARKQELARSGRSRRGLAVGRSPPGAACRTTRTTQKEEIVRLRQNLVWSLLLAVTVAAPAWGQVLSRNLLYTSLEPCRILDTRSGGGILVPGNATARGVNVVGLTDYSAQGGFAGDCHIPGFNSNRPQVSAIVVNFVAVGATGAGDLKAWPTDQAQPATSIINYANQSSLAGLNIANAIVLPVRQDMQGNDITIKSEVSATHVIADVVGYFFTQTDGFGDLFLGNGSGRVNVSGGGINNTGVGDSALVANMGGSENTAVGMNALAGNTGGTTNTAVGEGALSANTNGSLNTAVGVSTLLAETTGSFNIALGESSGAALTAGSNNIYIGNHEGTSESNVIRIGQETTDGTLMAHTSAFLAGVSGQTSASGVDVLINSSGQLGTTTSSIRFKDDVRDIGDESEKLLRLRPVSFYYKPEVDDGSHLRQFGLIAEEVSAVYPDLVVRGSDGKPQTVRYHLLVPLLLNELQAQRQKVDAQAGRLAAQESELAALRDQLALQQEQLAKVLDLVAKQAP
jgi:hypothetical protein